MRPILSLAAVALLLVASAPSGALGATDGPSRPSASGTARSASSAGRLDATARQRLVGDRLVTLQWIDRGDLLEAGTVTVRPNGNALSISGGEHGVGEAAGNPLRLSGKIVSADEKGVVVHGDILTRVAANGDGSDRRRSGARHFPSSGERRDWRRQEMRSPCSDVTDDVDIDVLGMRASAP